MNIQQAADAFAEKAAPVYAKFYLLNQNGQVPSKEEIAENVRDLVSIMDENEGLEANGTHITVQRDMEDALNVKIYLSLALTEGRIEYGE